jgi:epoxyqueuosine reductase
MSRAVGMDCGGIIIGDNRKMQVSTPFQAAVQQAATHVGFDLCGVAAIPPEDSDLKHFPDWISEGRAGEMAYLSARNDAGELKRAALANVAPWARSVIVCGLNYNADEVRSVDPHPEASGWISRYAWFGPAENGRGVDYHDALLRRLRQMEAELLTARPELRTWCYVDTGPVVERVYAKYAGLGWVGKNTCIINEGLGSYFFLGIILTSQAVDSAAPAPLAADRCGSCTRCIDACPTQALTPYKLDARRCISYLTIEKRGEIPEELRAGIGRHIFGCDICQDVCPWNGAESLTRRAPVTTAPEFQARKELVNPALDWLGEMSREDFNRVFKDSPVKRAKYSGVRRNVAIAMGNSGQERFCGPLEKMATEEDKNVAEAARWALSHLSRPKN